MYDHNTQATQFYLKDLERQALDCVENGKHRSSRRPGPIWAVIAVSCIVVGLIGLAGQVQLI